jgi:predicted small metal-binding protein
MDCDFVARGETDDELMRNGFERNQAHATKAALIPKAA